MFNQGLFMPSPWNGGEDRKEGSPQKISDMAGDETELDLEEEKQDYL